MLESNSKQFRMAAIKQLFVASVMLLVQIIIFFISAGYIADPRPWLYFGTAFAHYSVGTAVQYELPSACRSKAQKETRGVQTMG
jgi:hypothetical protein